MNHKGIMFRDLVVENWHGVQERNVLLGQESCDAEKLIRPLHRNRLPLLLEQLVVPPEFEVLFLVVASYNHSFPDLARFKLLPDEPDYGSRTSIRPLVYEVAKVADGVIVREPNISHKLFKLLDTSVYITNKNVSGHG